MTRQGLSEKCQCILQLKGICSAIVTKERGKKPIFVFQQLQGKCSRDPTEVRQAFPYSDTDVFSSYHYFTTQLFSIDQEQARCLVSPFLVNSVSQAMQQCKKKKLHRDTEKKETKSFTYKVKTNTNNAKKFTKLLELIGPGTVAQGLKSMP